MSKQFILYPGRFLEFFLPGYASHDETIFWETWWSSLGSFSLVLSVISLSGFLVFHVLYRTAFHQKIKALELTKSPHNALEKQREDKQCSTYTKIEPQSIVDLQTEDPLQLRPFKSKYHLTMALENTTFSEFLLMDKTYQSRIQLRRDLLAAHEQDTVACNPKANDAVFELYRWLTTIYLPHRFPHYFMLSRKNDKSGSLELKNTLTNEQITLRPSSPITALKTLGAHIDTDFLLLLPNTTTGKYHFEAFVTCFPSGFTTRSKLTLPLAAIHEPVPGYKDKIEKSMDRFFASLPAGRIVKRANWGITTTRKLFLLEGTHGHVGAESATPSDARAAAEITTKRDLEPGEEDDSDIDIGECVLRCERQTLHRLSETGALVFAFKTYQYELSDIKEEGNGEALAQAIDGLKAGNVPSMHVYKRGAVWGERVKEFLRA